MQEACGRGNAKVNARSCEAGEGLGFSAGRVLIVWDFDWSLVEENSDTWVVGILGASDIFQRFKAQACLSGAQRNSRWMLPV